MKIRVNVRNHPEGGVLTDQTHIDLSPQQPGARPRGISCCRHPRETIGSVTLSLSPCTDLTLGGCYLIQNIVLLLEKNQLLKRNWGKEKKAKHKLFSDL